MNKQKALQESLNRHKFLLEYSFFGIQGTDEAEGDPLTGEDPTAGGEEPVDFPEPPLGGEETPVEEPTIGDETPPEGIDAPPMDTAIGDQPLPGPDMGTGMGIGDEEVEVDITDLVQSSKDTSDKVTSATEMLNNMITKFDDMETKMSAIGDISSKIDGLEKEIERRNPTPVEKLEMRSMQSYPYNLKLTDFWDEKTQNSNIDIEPEDGEKEYVLTTGDVMSDYDETSVANSFNIQNDINKI